MTPENTTPVPDPEPIDYLKHAQELADAKAETVVYVDGKAIKLTEPDGLAVMQFFMHEAPNGVDENDYELQIRIFTQIGKLCMVKGLTDEQVFNILKKSGALANPETSEIMQFILKYCDATEFFKAGNSPEADADFQQPEHSESA